MLKKINPSIIQIEKSLITLILIFCFSYIIQFIIYPIVIFHGAEGEFYQDVRIRLAGQGLSSLGYFLGLNNLLIGKRKVGSLLLSILCFSTIFLMGFRTMLAGIVIISFVLFFRINGFTWKLFMFGLLALAIFFLVLQIPIFAEKFSNMNERQETQTFYNSDYIRLIEFQYFTKSHFASPIEFILGSGMPSTGSAYGRYMGFITDAGIYYVDWGLVGLSWIIGLTPVVFMISYAFKALILKVNKKYYYIGAWFLYLLLISITTQEFYRPGNFVVQAIALFIVEKASLTDKLITPLKATNRIIFKKT